jgi:nuclear control of ATPase protein 2
MALALAREKLHYSQDQLALLSKQIRLGDMTPVLQIYEEDIKSPLKSAVTGSLLRSVFVQIQKAKVGLNYRSSVIQIFDPQPFIVG